MNTQQIFIKNHLVFYPTPLNISYFFSFGFLAGIILISQILTGLFLAMYFSNDISLSFGSIEFFIRNINYGWFIRYLHSNGASFFFIIIYIHIFKGLYYRSFLYPRHMIWISGLFIFILLMATAFLGYVLPWGQMSFWGATVITNLLSVFPFIGDSLVFWLWGGFSIENPTLMRFFILHFILPFIILGFIFLHLSFLHSVGSSNILMFNNIFNYISFYPFFFLKDFYFFLFLIFFFFFFFFLKDFLFFLILSFFLIFFICYDSNFFNHSDNYIKANSLITPIHIVPEWYFLPFYAILRSIENKSFGVFLMFFSIFIFFLFPLLYFKFNIYYKNYFLNSIFIDKFDYSFNFKNNSSIYLKNNFYSIFIWIFLIIFILLGWIGQLSMNSLTLILGKILIFFYYFIIFLLFIFV